MGKKLKSKKARKPHFSTKRERALAKALPKLSLSSDPVGDRYRFEKPFVIRLTESDTGVHVPNRIQLFRTGTFKKLMPNGKHIQFSITKKILQEMVENFHKKVRGTDIALDFAHKSDEEAAAWFKDLILEQDGKETNLFGDMDWTPDGHAAVSGKKFRYVSPDFAFAWTDNETGEKYGATLFGAGLTNRPVIKNMAPTVELTEVRNMAKTVTKKISEMDAEEVLVKITAETDPEKKELLQLRLDELSEEEDGDDDEDDTDESGDDDTETPPPAPKKKAGKDPKKMNLEELQEAFQKQCDEMAEMNKKLAKTMAETERKAKETSFSMLLAEGKAVVAQKAAFMANDTVKFAELSQPTKFKAIGDQGKATDTTKLTAQEQLIKLADEAVKAGRGKRRDEVYSLILSENPDLNARYEAETSGNDAAE